MRSCTACYGSVCCGTVRCGPVSGTKLWKVLLRYVVVGHGLLMFGVESLASSFWHRYNNIGAVMRCGVMYGGF